VNSGNKIQKPFQQVSELYLCLLQAFFKKNITIVIVVAKIVIVVAKLVIGKATMVIVMLTIIVVMIKLITVGISFVIVEVKLVIVATTMVVDGEAIVIDTTKLIKAAANTRIPHNNDIICLELVSIAKMRIAISPLIFFLLILSSKNI